MPDVWTNSPKKLRTMLKRADWECGAEPKLLKGRDPEWLCTIQRPTWFGEIAIHGPLSFFANPRVSVTLLLALVFGIAGGYILALRSRSSLR